MKQAVIALLTITINRYSEANAHILSQKGVINDLTDILDYIEDFKEDSIEQSITSDYLEIIQLKKYIKELEETCEANNEVIRQQWEKIIKLEFENKELKVRLGALDELENVEGIK